MHYLFSLYCFFCFVFVLFFPPIAKMNHSRPHHDKHKTCDVELNEPVYENKMVGFRLKFSYKLSSL